MTLTRTSTQAQDVRDRRLPGFTLIAAIHNRRLMSWSDRGGASQQIGDQWAIRCATALELSIGSTMHFGSSGAMQVEWVIRLDNQPGVERDANRHQLENPDFFVLASRADDGAPVLFAADAKFAADRIKPSQVSQVTTQRLIEVPEQSTARELLAGAVNKAALDEPAIIDGAFLVPDAAITDLLLSRSNGQDPEADARAHIVRIPPESETLFDGLPVTSMIGTLARIDELPVSPRSSLLAAVYYFRVACACRFLWQEEHRPLLSYQADALEPAPGIIAAHVAQRVRSADSAYGLLVDWDSDLRRIIRARKEVQSAARLPVAMKEIRDRLDLAGTVDPKTSVTLVRRDLELAFREELMTSVGEIPATDPRPVQKISHEVSKAARNLRPAMLRLLDERIAHYTDGE